MENKKGVVEPYILAIILAVIALGILGIIYLIASGKMSNAIAYIQNMIRFG